MAAADVLFVIAAVLTVASGALAVTRKNPIYSAMFMMMALVGIAGVFLLMASPFLAVMQVLLYAGAIMVLFTFVIMLLNLRPEEMGEGPSIAQKMFAAVMALGVFALLALPAIEPGLADADASFAAGPPPAKVTFATEAGVTKTTKGPVDFGATEYFGYSIFGRFVLPFELVSVLVLAAVVAVMVLAKRDLARRWPTPSEQDELEDLAHGGEHDAPTRPLESVGPAGGHH